MLLPSQTWLPPRRLLPLRAVLMSLPLWDSAPALGTLIVGAPGTGKTILESLMLLCHLIRGLPGVVLDPLGTLSDAFLFRLLWFVSEYPKGEDKVFRQRLRYIPLGDEFVVTCFPIYYQRHGESLWDAGNRLITVLERSSPQLATSPLTWPAAKRLGLNAGMLFTALGYGGLTEIESLLFQTINWQQSGKFDEAIRRNPQATDAVSYFRDYFLQLPRSEQRRIAGTFLDQVYPFVQSPTLQAIFSARSTPGIDWEEVEALGQIVILNFKGITDPLARRLAEQWILESLYPHLKERGRRPIPFVLLIDEFAKLAAQGTEDNKPLTDLFDELMAQYARNNQIFVTAALQSVDQVDERLARTLFRLGTLITGRAGSNCEARTVADHLFRKDIYRVQHYRKVWAHEPVINSFTRSTIGTNHFVIDLEPQYMSLENQIEDAVGMIQKLGALEFLYRPARSEGAVSQEVLSLALADAITDPDTGEYIFPYTEQDAALISQMQQRLAARTGVPIGEILKEQEERLTTSTSQQPRKPQPAGELDGQQPAGLPENGRESQTSRRAEPAQPAPRNVKEPQSLPALDDQQNAMLTLLIEHPETPVSLLSKELRIRAAEATKIRENLKTRGLIHELEVRPAGTGAGRPLKWIIPTMQAFDLLGREPPAGRGGVIHRQLQQMIAAGTIAKGYTAHCEKPLRTGAIVDVHLEREGQKVGVEIAVMSHPRRELAHIQQILDAGYDKVVTVFLDSQLLERTREAGGVVFSAAQLSRIQLIPISRLAVLIN
jgi:hypothetical protein